MDKQQKAKALYDAINRYYSILIGSITPDDYNSIKDVLKYTDDYDDHIKHVKSFIKESTFTIEKISEFLESYVEFQRNHYVTMINVICDEIEKNPKKFKQEAYKGILKFAEQLDEYNEDEYSDDNEVQNSNEDDEVQDFNEDEINKINNNEIQNDEEIDFSDESENGIFYIGNNEIILKTYGDPLIRNLYTVLFMTFETENNF